MHEQKPEAPPRIFQFAWFRDSKVQHEYLTEEGGGGNGSANPALRDCMATGHHDTTSCDATTKARRTRLQGSGEKNVAGMRGVLSPPPHTHQGTKIQVWGLGGPSQMRQDSSGSPKSEYVKYNAVR